jgi:ribosomal protein L11 methylase PrmA
MRRTSKSILTVILLLMGAGLKVQDAPYSEQEAPVPDVVYVGTPHDVIFTMLEMAHISKDDLVYDLGCGDGRVVVMAAKRWGCRGTGYDIDPERVRAAQANVRRNQVEHLVEIIQQDLFTLDFSPADVFSLYLLPEINERLLPQFEKLKPGTRLLFHEYGLEGIQVDRAERVVSNEDNSSHNIFLYTTPLRRTP